jgi:hypothetical protein
MGCAVGGGIGRLTVGSDRFRHRGPSGPPSQAKEVERPDIHNIRSANIRCAGSSDCVLFDYFPFGFAGCASRGRTGSFQERGRRGGTKEGPAGAPSGKRLDASRGCASDYFPVQLAVP